MQVLYVILQLAFIVIRWWLDPNRLAEELERAEEELYEKSLKAFQERVAKRDTDAVAAALAERLAHPGDLLAEIDKLPAYARTNQLVKIDGVTSALMKEKNEAAYVAMEGDLKKFGLVAAALGASPAPLNFMELELPGRSPGITPEPHESWFLETDY